MPRQPEYTELDYLKFAVGKKLPCVLVDAVHAAKPKSDLYTGEIAEAVASRTGCHCIIATVSRTEADINRPLCRKNRDAIVEYRQTIRQMLEEAALLSRTGELVRPLLHVAVHGIRNRWNRDIELGTVYGESCSEDVREWVENQICDWALAYRGGDRAPIVLSNRYLTGDSSKPVHCKTYGNQFNTIQMEIARWLREDHQPDLISMLSTMVQRFARRFTTG